VRRYWNWYHHYVGRAAVACAMANVSVGLPVAREAAALGMFYDSFLAVWVAASAVIYTAPRVYSILFIVLVFV
jgi:hypothetical protein